MKEEEGFSLFTWGIGTLVFSAVAFLFFGTVGLTAALVISAAIFLIGILPDAILFWFHVFKFLFFVIRLLTKFVYFISGAAYVHNIYREEKLKLAFEQGMVTQVTRPSPAGKQLRSSALLAPQAPQPSGPNGHSRSVLFPDDRSLGALTFLLDDGGRLGDHVEARGLVRVPEGCSLSLYTTWEDVGRDLAPFTSLRSGDLTELWIRAESASAELDHAMGYLAGLTGLRQLSILAPITNIGFRPITRLTSLESLTVNNFLAVEWLDLAAGLSSRQRSWVPTGTHNALTDISLKAVVGMPQLKELSLMGSAITGRGLGYLRSAPALKKLTLSFTRLSDKDLVDLDAILTLQALDLSWTDITDAGLMSLVGLEKLRTLLVFGTDVTAEGVQRFRSVVPACSVFYEPGTNEEERGMLSFAVQSS